MFKYHKNLAPKIWGRDGRINEIVALSLEMIATEFVRYLGDVIKLPISRGDVRDVIVHGSTTNYYWDSHSDIDLCVVADLKKLRQKLAGVNDFLLIKSLIRSWRTTFSVSIFGRGVDITLVDVNDGYDATHKKVGSAYSVRRRVWIHKPVRIGAGQLREIRKMTRWKYRVIMRQCRYILRHNKSADFIDMYLAALRNFRISTMRDVYVQPISSTTMAFKMVRNTGMLRKLRARAKKLHSQTYRVE